MREPQPRSRVLGICIAHLNASVGRNMISGEIPANLTCFANLFQAYDNRISGYLPECSVRDPFTKKPTLRIGSMLCENNRISGTIPDNFSPSHGPKR